MEIRINVDKPVCDFCSSADVKWRLLATTDFIDTTVENITIRQESVGDWAACDICMDLIQRNAVVALTDRSMATMVEQCGPPPEEIRSVLRQELERIHVMFWQNYTGMYEPHDGSMKP